VALFFEINKMDLRFSRQFFN